MKWDDLQFVLAVEREGGLAGAARALGVNYSTAHRRLSQIERSLGTRVFNRRRDGYHLTPAAREVSDTARRIEAEVLALSRRVMGADKKLGGTIRVSTSQLMGIYVLPRMFERFAGRFPGVGVEVAITDQLANLKRSDADVVIRATASPPDYLSGINMGPMSFAAYARKEMASRPKPLHAYEWIGYIDTEPVSPLSLWLRQVVPGADCRYRFDSAAAVREATIAGLAASVLPCLVGETHSDLVRISDVYEDAFNLWILTHAELRKSARIRSFMRFFQHEIETFLGAIPAARA